jgi:hypothetical protein
MTRTSLLAYPRAHWVGQQGLAWSFWVNLVALRLVISFVQPQIFALRTQDAAPMSFPLVALLICAHAIVFLWQIVGVVRASEHHLRQMGSVSTTWGAQLGILIAFLFVLSDIWGVWLMTKTTTHELSFADKMDIEHSQKYDFHLSDDKKTILFSGVIALGSTKALAVLLAENPRIETLMLTSGGGNIYEARGIAKLVRATGLDTVAVDVCSSSCTVAFIGGGVRRLAPGARLGFHQYRTEAAYDVPFANPKAEQARDLKLFRQAGVKDWFLRLMFRERPESIWYPSLVELQSAGVVTMN